MTIMKKLFSNFLKDESGAQMAEYALLLVLIGLIVAAAALWLSGKIQEGFQAIGDCISSASSGDGTAADCPSFTPSS